MRCSVECVCRSPKTNIWFQASVLLNHACVFSPRRSVFAVFSCCSFIRCPGSFTNLLKMQRCWPFEWDSQIFFYMVVFVWRKKKTRSLFYTQIRCKKAKKSSSKKLVFHYPLTQRNLSFAILVICSTFVNTMFLINVHHHECRYNCKRFKLRIQTRNKFFGEKMNENKWARKRTGLHLGNNLLSCKQLNLYCTFSQFLKSTFLTYLVFKISKAVCVT